MPEEDEDEDDAPVLVVSVFFDDPESAGLAGESLAKITQAVASIGDLNLQIATHAAMQNIETDQISASIEAIVGMALQTASEVKNSEAAGAELAALVADLNTLVGQFKVD